MKKNIKKDCRRKIKMDYPEKEKVTVISLLQDLLDYSTAESIVNSDTGEEITRTELQELIFQKLEQLINLLGIELEE